MDSSAYLPEDKGLHHQYVGLQDYNQYPGGYANSSIYITKSPTMAVSGDCTQQTSYKIQSDSCTVLDAHAQLSSQDPNVSSNQERAPMHAVRYIHASHYDEIPDYGLTASSVDAVDTRFNEDPTLTYGYVSDANFALTAGNATADPSRSFIFDRSLNGVELVLPTTSNDRSFENYSEVQNKMSQLSLDPSEAIAQIRDIKGELNDGSGSDVCSAMRWRDPNLSEVISFLDNPNNAIKANAAAYLQHLCYMDDPNKQRTRTLGGIPPLIRLLSSDAPEVYKNACGALRNLSYGRQNDENKRAIRDAGGIAALINLLCKVQDSEVKELVTGVLWNMSSCEDIKRSIIDESLHPIVNNIIKPHSGWDPVCPGDTCFSTVFRNASGVLRNVSSAGEYARSRLRDADNLIECLLYVIKTAIEKNNIGNKTVENCVCILRNLSYRCQEVEDPNYDKQPMLVQSRSLSSSSKGENLGCFGTNRKRKDSFQSDPQAVSATVHKSSVPNIPSKGYENLWQPEVVQYYLTLLQSCSNPETLEAAAGAIQNLSACFWQPSIDIRATVRKEKGLPILVELLRMEVDRVVCAVATALRNLAIDQRNKELIGKYAMRDLVQKLPSGNPQHDQNTSDDTISAVLATINEVIKKNPEFSRSLLDAGGVERLLNITKQWQRYTSCVLKFASQVLFTMWQHHELRDVYKKNGWKEQDFVTKYLSSQSVSSNSPNNANSTLNRPMASQGRTRYEDRTLQRVPHGAARNNSNDGLTIRKESNTFCQMGDDSSFNGAVEENYQSSTMYIPINSRNHSN